MAIGVPSITFSKLPIVVDKDTKAGATLVTTPSSADITLKTVGKESPL